MDLTARLDELRDKFVRRDFLEELYEQAVRYNKEGELIPFSTTIALDSMLQDIINKELHFRDKRDRKKDTRKERSVLVGHRKFVSAAPMVISKDKKYQVVRYVIPFLDEIHSHDIRMRSSVEPGNLDVLVKLEDKRIYMDFVENLVESTIEIGLDEMLFMHYIPSSIFPESQGAVIRRACPNGKISISGESTELGLAHAGEYVIGFINYGKEVQLFDLNGEMLFERLGRGEDSEKARLEKMLENQEKMEKVNPEDISLIVAKYLRRRWQANPEQFDQYGQEYILSGEALARTTATGKVQMRFYQFGKRKHALNTSRYHGEQKVKLRFSGQYVAVYDSQGEMINCHELSEPVNGNRIYTVDDVDLKRVSISTINGQRLRRTLGNQLYRFSPEKVEAKYGRPLSQARNVGILANTVTSTFEILINDERGVHFVEVEPESITASNRARYGIKRAA